MTVNRFQNTLTSTKASREGTALSSIGYSMRSGSMRLIHFKQLEMLLEVVESSENIASRATVLKLLTSSRFIARVRRRYWETNQGDVNKP